MKYLNRKRILSILLTLFLAVMMTVPAMGLTHTQVPVNLGTALSFAVLAGSTITNTGTTNISGDAGGNVGLHPGTVFSGQASAVISGSVNLADAVALQAKNDLVIGYNDAIGRSPVTRISTELGGTTLTPGTYDSADGTFQITGTLTLDALGNPEAVFIFKTASTLITASASNIRLINGAVFCRVFWAVGSSATLGTTSHFVGHLMAMESITATTGATVQGQLLARNGAVTLDSNTITNGICLAPPVVVPPIVDPVVPPVVDPVVPPVVVPVVPPVVDPVVPPVVVPVVPPVEQPVIIPVVAPIATVVGGQLPETASNLNEILLMGVALVLAGGLALLWSRKKEVR